MECTIIRCTIESNCPKCGTKDYKQDDEEYPIMLCRNGHRFWSD